MAEPGEVLDCLDQTGSRLAELEVVDSLRDLKGSFGRDDLV